MIRTRKKSNRRVALQKKRPIRSIVPALRATARVVGGVTLLGAIVAGSWWLMDRPVNTVQIEGRFERVTAVQIEGVVKSALGDGLLSTDLDSLRALLKALPWVDQVRVRRQWPGTIHVRVAEQMAAARWGEAGLLNTRGELFLENARHVPAELPHLSGPEGSEWDVAQRYLALRGPLMTAGFQLRSVTMDARGAWRLSMAGDIEVHLGRAQIDRRIERFLKVVTPLISGRAGAVDYVDMRYANGFAIGWHEPPEESPVAEDDADA
jgi:cell division protein FtsQ